MFKLPKNHLQFLLSNKNTLISSNYNFFSSTLCEIHFSSLIIIPPAQTPAATSNFSTTLLLFHIKNPKDSIFFRYSLLNFYSSRVLYKGPISRSLRGRISKRAKALARPVLNEALFHRIVSHFPARFTHEDLHNAIVLQDDPLVCLELFNWASQQHRFKHNVLTYHVTIKKLGAAKMYEEMDVLVNQVLAIPSIGSEALYNTMIYYYTEARKLIRAVNIFKHMHDCRKLDCRPSIRTYNTLLTALLNRGKNTYVNHMYMETARSLFKQMVDDGVDPDIYCLNSMIKGYVLSLHVNDALRIFHQMAVVYNCEPNAYTYDFLIHGLCAQGRTNNAREMCDKMKESGFVPSGRSYNSLVNSLALEGKVDEAVKFLWEMADNEKFADFITYRTVLDEVSRQKRSRDAVKLLDEFQEKNLVDGHTHRKLLSELKNTSRSYSI